MGKAAAALFGVLAGAMAIYPAQAAEAALRALSLWARGVVPVLGPFMIASQMIAGRLSGGPGIRVMMGWLCGSPGGAKLLSPLAADKKTALRYAALTGTMSPMFFLGTAAQWLGSRQAGILLLACHLAGAAITALLTPGGRRAGKLPPAPLPLSSVLGDCAQALPVIGLCMMLGGTAAEMARCALPRLPSWAACALQCLLEVSGGVQALSRLNPPLVLPLACGACSLGGLSILLQNAAFWKTAGLGAGRLLPLRLLHGGISFLLCLLAVKFL